MFTTLGHYWTVTKSAKFQKHLESDRNALFVTEEREFNGRLTHVVHFSVVVFLCSKTLLHKALFKIDFPETMMIIIQVLSSALVNVSPTSFLA